MQKVLMSWSTGKDSAWALYQLSQQSDIRVEGLFCTINKTFERTAMHAVRLELLKLQAERLNLPLSIIEIPYPCTNDDYRQIMGDYVAKVQKMDISSFVFGDLFLEDIRDYRIAQLKGTGITALFPLWKKPTATLAREMIDSGQKAIITCVDPKQLDCDFVGREFDHGFLDDLPENVDPCGENGEFHSFVYESPLYSSPINIRVGEKVLKDGFMFADLLKEK